MKSLSVTLSPLEQEVLFWMAKVRHEPKDKAKRPDRKISGKSGIDVHIHGLYGEAPVGKVLDAPLYLRMSTGIDRGTDFIFNKKTISVKHREQARYEYFILPYWKDRLEADIGILVSPTNKSDTMEITGWLDSALFDAKKERCDFMPKPPWGVHKRELKDISLLGLPPGDPNSRTLRVNLDWSDFPLGKVVDVPTDLEDTLEAIRWGHEELMKFLGSKCA